MKYEQPELILPPDFEDYAWEVESKGVFWDVHINYEGQQYAVTFYEPVRLAQDAAEQLNEGKPFFEQNIIVIKEVTKEAMELAVSELVKDGKIGNLKATENPA
jgi:hypothetical protein